MRFASICAGLACVGTALHAAALPDLGETAGRFGALEGVMDISLSPDGTKIAYVAPGPGQQTFVVVAPAEGGEAKPVAVAAGKPMRLSWCGWASPDRLICSQYGLSDVDGQLLPFTRMAALDADGKNSVPLAQRARAGRLRISQFDGDVIDWGDGATAAVYMTRDNVPEETTGTHVGRRADGLSLELVDTRTLKSRIIEPASRVADGWVTDGRGTARIMIDMLEGDTGLLTGTTRYLYRKAGSRNWERFSEVDRTGAGLRPVAVDGGTDMAYALRSLNGRDALYRVALDGSMKAELAYANPLVDVDGVVTIGRRGRVIGARYTTDRNAVEYFDPEYRALAAQLSRAIPSLPLIRFEGASADENRLLIHAASDVDPGRYYLFDRKTRRLGELLRTRPELENVKLLPMQVVQYPARDGTPIPAYLTLPQGGARKGMPTIVMPHGGPASRDVWGFDWLAQFYAQRGYAVLQPNFRGSTGYGDEWLVVNGFRSWQIAIGDVVDAGRWLVAKGLADPAKLGIVGWSYGGYAALQANVMDPKLFRAVVAIAPVTDFGLTRRQADGFTNRLLVQDFVGQGANAVEGSPLRHAAKFDAPVLMFHGTNDLNVDIGQSRAMDAALRRAGKKTELVVYEGLDHSLPDGRVRASMLARSDGFLREALKLE